MTVFSASLAARSIVVDRWPSRGHYRCSAFVVDRVKEEGELPREGDGPAAPLRGLGESEAPILLGQHQVWSANTLQSCPSVCNGTPATTRSASITRPLLSPAAGRRWRRPRRPGERQHRAPSAGRALDRWPNCAPSTRSIGRASGATTWTSSPRARRAAATSSPMKLAPRTTARRAVLARATMARQSASDASVSTCGWSAPGIDVAPARRRSPAGRLLARTRPLRSMQVFRHGRARA